MPDVFLSGTGCLNNVAFRIPEGEHQRGWIKDLEAAGFGRSNEEIYEGYHRRCRKADMAAMWGVKEWLKEG